MDNHANYNGGDSEYHYDLAGKICTAPFESKLNRTRNNQFVLASFGNEKFRGSRVAVQVWSK